MKTIVDFLRNHAQCNPQKTALIMLKEQGDEPTCLSYAELDAKAQRIASELQQRYQVGDRAMLLYRPGIEFIVAFLACQYAGLIPVPTSLSSRKPHHLRRIEQIGQDASISLIMTASDLQDDLQEWFKDSSLAWLECLASDEIKTDREWTHPNIGMQHLAFLQYTSGSTGNPKGVMVSHGNLIHNSQLIKEKYQHTEDTVMGGWLPFYHDMGLIGLILQTLYLGASLVLMAPVDFVKRPSKWLHAISRYRISTTGGPNFGFQHCVERIREQDIEGIDLSCWQVCFNGAEPVRQTTMEAFTQRFSKYGFKYESFYPCYGLAEATLFVAGGTPGLKHASICIDRNELESHRAVLVAVDNPTSYTLVSCGQPHGVVVVDNQTRTPVADGQVGEIWLQNGSVAVGYWNNPDATAETFQAVLTNENDGYYMRTGDLGFFHDGELYITGRSKDMLIVNGRNIYPQDIEQHVGTLDTRFEGRMAAAFSINGVAGEEVVVVQEVANRGMDADNLSQLAKQVRRDVGEYFEVMVASVVLTTSGTIPRTTSGKVQRRKTRLLWENEVLECLHQERRQVVATQQLTAA